MAKKKTLGMETKPKTLEEINQEYSNLAARVGHKTMLAQNTEKLIATTLKEINDDVTQMNTLARQGQALKSMQDQVKTIADQAGA